MLLLYTLCAPCLASNFGANSNACDAAGGTGVQPIDACGSLLPPSPLSYALCLSR